MSVITNSDELVAFCRQLSTLPAITIDTEFLRDRTYWPKLCLLQLASPSDAKAIDTLADGLDLTPVLELLRDRNIIKVFHAARQDLEIFYYLMGEVPEPIFDTQLAAMVAGYGDSVGYETLVKRIANARVDKVSQFTDWSRRPLKQRQIDYALADVTYLWKIYETLSRQLEKSGRSSWLDEELAILTNPATYDADIAVAWRRLKIRQREPRYLAVLQEVAAWREHRAQDRDVPRNRILRDEVLQQIASERPTSLDGLCDIRGMPGELKNGTVVTTLLSAVQQALALPEAKLPKLTPLERLPRDIGPVVDLLKVLLKMTSERQGVAQKLIATVSDLERIAADDGADVPALTGWRRDIFGADALALKKGQLGLAIRNRKVQVMPLDDSGERQAAD